MLVSTYVVWRPRGLAELGLAIPSSTWHTLLPSFPYYVPASLLKPIDWVSGRFCPARQIVNIALASLVLPIARQSILVALF